MILRGLVVMDNIGNDLLRAIYANKWCRINYKNQEDQETKYMIGVKRIDAKSKKLSCDIFNVTKSKNTIESFISYENILSLEICDDTFYNTPKDLLDFIDHNPEAVSFLKPNINKNDLIDYYRDCFKLDTVPYLSNHVMVPGIDNDKMMENSRYYLNDNQFQIIASAAFYKKENKEDMKRLEIEKIENNLVINELSIRNKDNSLYVLAFRYVRLDIKNQCLVADKDVIINKEFYYNSDIKEVMKKASINKYMSEEQYYLLENFEENKEKIIDVIREYNDTKTSSYKSTIMIDTNPHFIVLEKKYAIDVDTEFNKIKSILNDEYIPLPLRTFFGDSKSKLARKLKYPIFTIDDKYNIDQINAINSAMRSPASYIQGPPGTGKTKTILNAILTAVINKKTVLVTSNNNIPMDGIYNEICALKYNEKEQLLFPAIRLGSMSNCENAVLIIRKMFETAKHKKIYDSSLDKYKKNQIDSTKELIELLEKHEKNVDLRERLKCLKLIQTNCQNQMFSATKITPQIIELENELKKNGNVNMDKLQSLMYSDYKNLFISIHFETAKRLQKLKRERYRELYNIVIDANEDNKHDKAKELRKFLHNPENLEIFKDIYPVIITTNLSATYLGEGKELFDIVMMDEAGQCNVANALLPISKAKQIMLVGDPQQLKPVIVLDPVINKKLKDKYKIPEDYDYIDNSIYTTYTKVDVKNTETLLSYHYRCDKKIIEFSNKKYYNNKLKIESKSSNSNPLVFVDTSKEDYNSGNDKNSSEIEARMIVQYKKRHLDESIGVITPFVKQKECIEYYLKQNGIDDIPVGTVHAFQGDQKDIIIFSTAITNHTQKQTYNWLKNNKELINVAISRAKSKLIVLANKKAVNSLSEGQDDMHELIDYVQSEGESKVTNVSPKSFALGTRSISTESEKALAETINQIFSVVNNNCYISRETSVASVLNADENESNLFYQQRFDIVIFEKGLPDDRLLLAIELNGPEHYSDEEVKRRDLAKKKICQKHHLTLLTIPRDCARDYDMIKKELRKMI